MNNDKEKECDWVKHKGNATIWLCEACGESSFDKPDEDQECVWV